MFPLLQHGSSAACSPRTVWRGQQGWPPRGSRRQGRLRGGGLCSGATRNPGGGDLLLLPGPLSGPPADPGRGSSVFLRPPATGVRHRAGRPPAGFYRPSLVASWAGWDTAGYLWSARGRGNWRTGGCRPWVLSAQSSVNPDDGCVKKASHFLPMCLNM
jgi:hypothetical protein